MDVSFEFIIAVVIAAVILIGSWPVSQALKHESRKPLAAYLVFVSVFALSGAAVFMVAVSVLAAVGLLDVLNSVPISLILVILVLVPAALLARRSISRKAKQRMPR
jgi:hypothetical protein